MQEWNKGWDKEGTRSKPCQSPGGAEEMSKVKSVEHGVRCMEDRRQQCRGVTTSEYIQL